MTGKFADARSLFGQNRLLRLSLFLVLFYFAKTAVAHNDHPLGKQLLDWQPDPAIARVLSLNFNAHAGHFIVAWRPPGGIESIEDRQCLHGPYFLFDVDDSVAFDTDATVTLLRRFCRGERIHEAHCAHAYQHAARMVGSHQPISLTVGMINIFWLAPVGLLVGVGRLGVPVGLALAYLPLLGLAVYFRAGVAERATEAN